jgi:hypothetical protein
MEINMAFIIVVLGMLVFAVNVITEVTKNIWPLDQVHTNYYVTVLSIVLTVLTYFVYLSYTNSKFIWYYMFAVIVSGFIVAYLAMFGWEKLIKLWQDSQKGDR